MSDQVKSYKYSSVPVFPTPLHMRLLAAREAAEMEGELNRALWPHQRFSLTIGELLDAAIKGSKP